MKHGENVKTEEKRRQVKDKDKNNDKQTTNNNDKHQKTTTNIKKQRQRQRQRQRRDIVRGRARFLWGEVDVSTEDCDEDVLVPAARFNRQLTG